MDVFVSLIVTSVAVVVTSNSNCNLSSWSEWIDRRNTVSGIFRRGLSKDFGAMLPEDRQLFCDGGAVVGVQCTYDSKGRQNVTCSIEDGLRCYGKDNVPEGCNHYKIRYFCECPLGIHKRSSSSDSALLKNCGKWSRWKNTHHPSNIDQNDMEIIDQSFVKSMCPTDIGAIIPIIQCRDEHTNQTFQGDKNYGIFRVSCKDVHSGLSCTHMDGKCNDFSVRFFCSCSQDVFKQGNKDKKTRFPRAVVSLPQACNSWTIWINHHHPNDSATGHDVENITRTDLEPHCPLNRGATITDHHCRDDKGEPFKGFKTTIDSNVSCELSGYVCTPHPGRMCFDFQIQFYCKCPQQLSPETTVTTSNTTASSKGKSSALLSWPTSEEDGNIFGKKTVSVCVVIVVICAILTMCHFGVTLYAVRSLSKKLGEKKMTSVYPSDQQ